MAGGLAVVLLAMVTAAAEVTIKIGNLGRMLRPEGESVQRLIDTGIARSETVRRLIAQLDNSDVVVHIRFSQCTGRVPACLLWASSTPERRRLLIKLDRFGGSEDHLVALLAHELQHACETASAAAIVDASSFQKAFDERGWKSSHGFETQEAKEVTRQVQRELRDRHATSAPQPRARR